MQPVLATLIRWQPAFGWSEVIALLTATVAVAALIGAIKQLSAARAQLQAAGLEVQRAARDSRHRFLFDTVDRYFRDPEQQDFFYRLDYQAHPKAWRFDPASFPHSKEERLLDGVLYTFD